MQADNAKPITLAIGEYSLHAIPTGVFGLDGGTMFGSVPKVLWEKSNPSDAQNRIPLEARALLLKGKPKNILIDVGIGGDFIQKYGEKAGGKFAEMYKVSDSTVSLEKSLQKHGLNKTDITDVVLTHLHFDHAGGSTCSDSNGHLVPTFPKAKYYVQNRNYEIAKQPNIRERASYLPANFEPLREAGVLNFTNGNQQNILPGISVEVSNGHTQGHQMVQVSDGKTTLVYCGDVIPTSSHVRLAWVMGYDLDPLRIIEEKRNILTRAAESGWYLFFEHDPYCDMARVIEEKGDFKVNERMNLI